MDVWISVSSGRQETLREIEVLAWTLCFFALMGPTPTFSWSKWGLCLRSGVLWCFGAVEEIRLGVEWCIWFIIISRVLMSKPSADCIIFVKSDLHSS